MILYWSGTTDDFSDLHNYAWQKETERKHATIVSAILALHVLTGYESVAATYGVAKSIVFCVIKRTCVYNYISFGLANTLFSHQTRPWVTEVFTRQEFGRRVDGWGAVGRISRCRSQLFWTSLNMTSEGGWSCFVCFNFCKRHHFRSSGTISLQTEPFVLSKGSVRIY